MRVAFRGGLFFLREVDVMEERRKFPRVAVSIEVRAKHGDLPMIEAKSFDMSEGGIGLLFAEDLPRGKVMELEMNLPVSPVVAHGEVTWTKEVETEEGKFFQTGIEFTDIKPEDKAKLKDFLDKV
jgi:c-di-GMP-binding flagellar brake protein YcgR